jgi:hypothetical protein
MSRNLFTRPTTPALAAFLSGRAVEPIGFVGGRAIYPIAGGAEGDDPPERPEDVSEDEWNALGDPGKQAIVRIRAERDEARSGKSEAERQLTAARARPTPPRPPAAPAPNAGQQPQPSAAGSDDQPDIAALVQQAVQDAFKPFTEREQEREAGEAAQKIADAVKDAASALHDPSDALANIDLTKVTDGNGAPDAEKIKTELDDLVKRKPHLVKDTRRFAPPSAGASAGSAPTIDDRVKDTLARMQQKAGVKFADLT